MAGFGSQRVSLTASAASDLARDMFHRDAGIERGIRDVELPIPINGRGPALIGRRVKDQVAYLQSNGIAQGHGFANVAEHLRHGSPQVLIGNQRRSLEVGQLRIDSSVRLQDHVHLIQGHDRAAFVDGADLFQMYLPVFIAQLAG